MSTYLTKYKKSLSWSQFFYFLAKQITKRNIPETFLTSQELECLNQALSSFEQWEIFSNNNKGLETTTALTLNQIAAFRVRAMLLEQLIPEFYNEHQKCCQSSLTEIDQVWDQINECTTSSPIPQAIESTSKTSSHVPLLDIYHTLEFDMNAMIEQRKLEEYQAQEEFQEKSHATPSLLAGSDQFNLKFLLKGITENRDKTLLTDRELRHLLSEVNPHKSKWANEERVGQEELYEACEKVLVELKNFTEHSTPFLTKVNKRDAPDYFEVIKQPMDLGTVTKKLKNSHYNSKQEFARDLYLIYDNCLEYNTDPASEYRKHANAMRRKTDRLLTRVPEIEVKERLDDLEESEEESEIVSSFSHFDNKRERSVTYESIEEDIPTAVSTSFTQHHYSGKIPMKGTKPQEPTLTEIENEDLHNELDVDKGELQNQLWRTITKKTRAKFTNDVEKQYQFDFGNRQAILHYSLNMTRLYLMEQLHHQPESINKLIRCASTAFARWIDRNDLKRYHEFDLDSEDEGDFGSTFFSRKNEPKPNDEDDALRNDLFLPEYMMTPNLPEIKGAPETIFDEEDFYEFTEEELEEEVKRERPSFDIYPSTRPVLSGTNMYIDRNIKTLSNIRSIHSKCHAIRNNLPISSTAFIPDSPTGSVDISTPVPSMNPQYNTVEITKEATDQMMQKSIIQLLNHAGFESAHAQPLNILNEIMSDLLMNMGKTLRRYCDEYTHTMSSEEILSHTLQENDISGLTELERYVTDDIQLYGDKLVEINRRLGDTFQNLVKESVDDISNVEENVFNDEESFIIGHFGGGDDDVAEDFFGFKELGVDQEHENLKIPQHLWYAHDSTEKKFFKQFNTKHYKYPIPPKFKPATNSQSFIGLLQPWYNKRIKDNPMDGMIEDEYKTSRRSNRPRYPPVQHRFANSKLLIMNKMIPRNRVLKDGSNAIYQQLNNTETIKVPVKRKKAVMDEATKAERKKQRLELKAQKKQAEKDQKKKEREELKNKVKQKDKKKERTTAA